MKFNGQFNFKVAVFILSSLLPWPRPLHQSISCPRDQSFLVRNLVFKKWLPIYARYEVDIPLDCPLHPARDVYHPFHQAKVNVAHGHWSCAICGKAFVTERYLDLHLSTKHHDIITIVEDTVCPADFCDIVRCDVARAVEMIHSTANNSARSSVVPQPEKKKQTSVTALVRSAPSARGLIPLNHAGGFCVHDDEHTKRKGWLMLRPQPPHFQRSTVSPKTENITSDNDICHKEKKNSTETKSNISSTTYEDPIFISMKQQQSLCKDEDFLPLQLKCADVIHSCTSSLILQMSNQEFTSMQGELNRAVCWHLNCQHYWQDIWSSTSHSSFSWLFLSIIIIFFAVALVTSYCVACVICEERSPSHSVASTRPTSKAEDYPYDEEQESSGADWSYSTTHKRYISNADEDGDVDAIHVWTVDEQVYDDCLLSSRIKLSNMEEEENSIV